MSASDENLASLTRLDEEIKPEISLKSVFIWFGITFVVCFLFIWLKQYKLFDLLVLPSHPAAMMEYIAEALGATALLPLIWLGISQISKSMRNPNSRRKIMRNWFIAIICIQVLSFLTTPKPM